MARKGNGKGARGKQPRQQARTSMFVPGEKTIPITPSSNPVDAKMLGQTYVLTLGIPTQSEDPVGVSVQGWVFKVVGVEGCAVFNTGIKFSPVARIKVPRSVRDTNGSATIEYVAAKIGAIVVERTAYYTISAGLVTQGAPDRKRGGNPLKGLATEEDSSDEEEEEGQKVTQNLGGSPGSTSRQVQAARVSSPVQRK